jgi:hypothetical protein
LLQRSIHQTIEQRENLETLSMNVATHIPDGWYGMMEHDDVIGFLNGIPLYQAAWRNGSIHTRADRPGYSCIGTCHGYVKGAGFTHRCSTSHQYLEMNSTITFRHEELSSMRVLMTMHDFMFRSALRIGNTTEERQAFEVRRTVLGSVVVMDLRYLGAAIATMVCGIMLVVALMRGWWRLRRPVTLSPLETAVAMVRAPELRGIPPGTTIKQILATVSAIEPKPGNQTMRRPN